MATSPDIVRVATEPTASYADTVLDNLRESVIVFDARGENLPVVLVSASARRFFCGGVDDGRMLDTSLYGLFIHSSRVSSRSRLLSPMRLKNDGVTPILCRRRSRSKIPMPPADCT